jgi:hypothetical protein
MGHLGPEGTCQWTRTLALEEPWCHGGPPTFPRAPSPFKGPYYKRGCLSRELEAALQGGVCLGPSSRPRFKLPRPRFKVPLPTLIRGQWDLNPGSAAP